MKRARLYPVFGTLLFVLLFAVASGHAAEEGGNAANQQATELFKWINFAIVAGVLGWVFLKVTPPLFRANAEKISAAIAKAAAVKAEAERVLREAEGKLSRLQEEVKQLRAEAEREGAAEAERIRNVTRSDGQKVIAAAKAEIEAAERAARLELKEIAANLAVDRAESLLAKQLTPQTQDSLVAGFVKSLEARPN
jgi:F-type H+-transporting ATPase subunit b